MGNTIDGAGTGTLASPFTVSGEQLIISDYLPTDLTIQNGGVLNSETTYVGANPGSLGTVTVTGTGSQWTLSDDLFIGLMGDGTVNVLDGATVASDTVVIGYVSSAVYSSAFGSVTIDNATWTNTNDFLIGRAGDASMTIQNGGYLSTLTGVIANGVDSESNMTVDNSTWDATTITVGNYGDGTLDIQNGGTVNATSVYLAYSSNTSSGTITVDNAALNASSLLDIGTTGIGIATIRNNGTITVNSGAGTVAVGSNSYLNIGAAYDQTAQAAGTLEAQTVDLTGASSTLVFNHTDTEYEFNADITGDGSVRVESGETNLTGASDYTGATEMYGGQLSVTGSLNSTTQLTVYDGTFAVEDGGSVSISSATIGTSVADADAAALVDNASFTLTGDLSVGDNEDGSLTLQNSANLTAGNFYLGELSRGSGTAVIDNSSVDVSSGDLIVAWRGEGTLTLQNGASVDADFGSVGNNIGSVGTLVINNSTWTGNSLRAGYSGIGTITIQNGSTVTVGGGTGNLLVASNYAGTGTLNIGAAAGETAVSPGTLKAGVVQFGAGDGKLVFNHTDTGYEFDAQITGDGDVEVYSGETILTGSNFYTGTTTIYGGLLTVNGKILNSDVIVSGGSIGGTGTIITMTIASGGTIAPGNSIGTINVSSLTLNSGSTYEVELDNGGFVAGTNNDLISASGTVTIDGGTVNVTPENGTDDGTTYSYGTYTIITATGGITGTFEDVTDDFAFLDFALSYDNNHVYVTSSLADFCLSGFNSNQCATANALETVGSGTFVNAITSLSTSEAPGAVSLLSGEVHASVKTALVEDSGYARDVLNTRLRQAFDEFTPQAPTTAQDANLVDPQQVLWVKGFGGLGKIEDNGNTAGIDKYSGGILLGGDIKVAESWIIGVMGGYSQSYLNIPIGPLLRALRPSIPVPMPVAPLVTFHCGLVESSVGTLSTPAAR
ncbi:hypothetical protein [uncultured Cohaesibacter sp.]|uniref:hypothetical protein n=1 Tax=uncultured Cohaesibacter sp. TaxID=1002546 RepID=UPI0029C88A10|nr:hypothetical protein [uncultured Cohaesibacter sp.]